MANSRLGAVTRTGCEPRALQHRPAHRPLRADDARRRRCATARRTAAAVFEVFARRLPEGRRYGVVGGHRAAARGAAATSGSATPELAPGWPPASVDDATCEWLARLPVHAATSAATREGELYFPGSPRAHGRGDLRRGGACWRPWRCRSSTTTPPWPPRRARMICAAGDRPCIEMGSRRTHEQAAVAAARAAYLAGFAVDVQPRGRPALRRPDHRHLRARLHAAARQRGATPSRRRSPRSGRARRCSSTPTTSPQGIRTAVEVAGPEPRRRPASTPATWPCWPTQYARQLDALGAHRHPHRDRPATSTSTRSPRSPRRRSTVRRGHRPGHRLRRAHRRARLQARRGRGPAGRQALGGQARPGAAASRRYAGTAPTGTATEEVAALAGRARPPQPGDRALQVAARAQAASPVDDVADARASRANTCAHGLRTAAVGGPQALPRRAGHPHDLRGAAVTEPEPEHGLRRADRAGRRGRAERLRRPRPAGSTSGAARRSSRRSTPRSRPPRRRSHRSSTPRTGTPSRRRTSRRTAASGRCTASRTRGAPSCIPTCSCAARWCARGPRRGRLLRVLGARPGLAASRGRPSCSRCSGPDVRRLVVVGLAG